MSWYVRFILRNRLWVLTLTAVLTGLAGWSISHATFGTSMGEQMLGDRPEYLAYKTLSEDFGNDEVIVIGLDDPDFFSASGLTRLSQAVDTVEALDEVARCHSVLSAQKVRGDGKALSIENYGREVLETPERSAELLAALRSDEMARDVFLSLDGRATCVVVELNVDPGRPVEHLPAVVDRIIAAFTSAGFSPDVIHRAGFLAAAAESVAQAIVIILKIFPLIVFMLLLTVWVLFRRFWPAALSVAVALVAVAWTMGVLVAINPKLHSLVSLAPPVMLIVAFSDVVHLCSAYLTELSLRETKEQAILASVTEVGKACILTSATTFVGFASLMLVPDSTTKLLGFTLALGVGLALFLAVTLTPAVLSYMPRPRVLRTGTAASAQALLDRALSGSCNLAWRHPWKVVVGFAALGAVSVALYPRIHLEADFSRRFSQSSPIAMDTDWFQTRFAGTNMFELYISVDEDEGLLAPERLQAVARLQDALEATPEIDSAVSLVDLVRHIDQAIRGGDGEIPSDRKLLSQYMMLFESSGGEDLDRLVDFGRRVMRMDLRVPENGARATAAAGGLAERMAKEHLPGYMKVETTGMVYLIGHFFDEILAGQRRGLLVTSLVIMLMMMLGLRSFRVGALSMIPNLLPLVALGGAIGAFMVYVDSDVLLIAIMAIGIGVDDTIHFLSRLRIESRRASSDEDAVRRTLGYSGRGILMTTIILVAGFAPCALNSFALTHMLGTLLPFTLVVALLSDVLLVPAMVRLGWIGFPLSAGKQLSRQKP